jgi:hypothetical protein
MHMHMFSCLLPWKLPPFSGPLPDTPSAINSCSLLYSYFGTAESQSVHRMKLTMGQMERGENIAVIHYTTNRTQANCNITKRTPCNSRGGDCIQMCSISKVLYVITITMLNVAHLLHWSIIFHHTPQNTLTQVKEFCQFFTATDQQPFPLLN